MAILKDLAQVLHVHEQGNTSLVVVMLGRRLGQFRVHIKGARRWPKKGFEGGWDLLARGEILVYPRPGDALWIFRAWDERARPAVGRTVAMLRAASFLCESTEALTRPTAGSRHDEFASAAGGVGHTEDESPAPLYDLLAGTADALAAGARPGPLLLGFTMRALRAEGLLPALDVCSACHARMLRAVWLTATGVRCQDCVAAAPPLNPPLGKGGNWGVEERGEWLSPEAHRVLVHTLASARPVNVSAPAARLLGRALIVLVHGALEHDLRTLQGAARMVADMANARR